MWDSGYQGHLKIYSDMLIPSAEFRCRSLDAARRGHWQTTPPFPSRFQSVSDRPVFNCKVKLGDIAGLALKIQDNGNGNIMVTSGFAFQPMWMSH